MRRFACVIADLETAPRRGSWLFAPSDQLFDRFGPLVREGLGEFGMNLVDKMLRACGQDARSLEQEHSR